MEVKIALIDRAPSARRPALPARRAPSRGRHARRERRRGRARVKNLPRHDSGSPAADAPGADVESLGGEPGRLPRDLALPLPTALRRLPVRVALPVAAGRPAGVYMGRRRRSRPLRQRLALRRVPADGGAGPVRTARTSIRASPELPLVQRQPADRAGPGRRGPSPSAAAKHDHLAGERPHLRGARACGHVLEGPRHRRRAGDRPRQPLD